jgi:transcription elongation factor GreB
MTEEKAKPAPIYMTPACAERLKAELKETLYRLRPDMVKTAAWAASNGDRSENADYHYAKKMLRQYDGRIRFLTKRLEGAIIVDPLEQAKIAKGRVLFGCTVTVEDGDGEEKIYSIVGVDEYDPARGYVSWVSPIGRALLGKREGDEVSFETPGGRAELEVVRVEYRALD